MKFTFKNFISTCFFILFILTALGCLTSSDPSGLFFILLAILVFPPFLSYLEKIGKKPKLPYRIIICVILFFLAGATSSPTESETNLNLTPTVIVQDESGNTNANINTDENVIETSQSNVVTITPEVETTTTPVIDPTITPTNVPVKDEPNMKVHFIDVGQGDSILIESSKKYMLIDAGENNYGTTVVSYLENVGVSKLDYVIGTHPHSDHIGGLDTVINSFDIGKVILPPKEHTTKTFEDLLDAIENNGLKITKPIVGDTYQIGEASFTIIAPNDDYGDDLNNWSVGIKLINEENSFIFSGDAESKAEKDIIANNIDISSDVLKLNHHGSSTSSSYEFLQTINPSHVVITSGKNNSYGHPHTEVMNKLKQLGAKIYRTDEQGTIIASSDGKNITWNVEATIITPAPTAVPTPTFKPITKAPTPTLTPKPTDAPSKEEVPDTVSYILNRNTRKFHFSYCRSVKQMKESNKIYFEGTRDEVINKGYVACKNCNP